MSTGTQNGSYFSSLVLVAQGKEEAQLGRDLSRNTVLPPITDSKTVKPRLGNWASGQLERGNGAIYLKGKAGTHHFSCGSEVNSWKAEAR